MTLKDTSVYRTQGDQQVRAVTLANLIAMCERASGTAHVFQVPTGPSSQRAQLVYSNPDEYGHEAWVIVWMPVFPNDFEPENPYVVLRITSAHGGRDSADRAAAEETIASMIFDQPTLYRKRPCGTEWKTEEKWLRHALGQFPGCAKCRLLLSPVHFYAPEVKRHLHSYHTLPLAGRSGE